MRRALALAGLLAAFGVPLAYAQEVTTTEGTSTGGTTTEETPPPPTLLIPHGVTIAGVSVGGLTADQARVAVRAFFARPVTFTFKGRTKTSTPWWVGASAGVESAVANALAAVPGQTVALSVRFDGTRLRVFVARLARAWYRPPVNSRARLRYLRPYITRARVGYRIRQYPTRTLIRTAFAAHERGPIATPYRVLQPRITRSNFGPVIVIRRASHRLYLYKGSQYWTTFGVAVGMPQYPTPLGSFSIASKQRNPWWYPPSTAWAAGASPIPPGPGNPLGTRWMGLSRAGVGIHGTPDSASIGYSASHGCIRMRISEAEWLFERVYVGTRVFIVSA
jgi:lipoprotein-anchoring transpeptidase ErfK/SrfK